MQNSAEKEEFKGYLEKSGVIDALTKVLVGLYEESDKPSDALEFIKKHLGNSLGIDVDALKQENADLKAEVEALTHRVEELSKKLEEANKN
ncbi:hypothetical protein CYY_005205 [Polysphondylium violaceum]|uniref:c-Myc-binding protein n=1 Tax=Polysphondylium violaceum TaxID=133409 RepID=A0A8J4Q3S2_9MYCE|nr:hypothetical protein CYY_005205 [Polysphondylium violaceum]